MAKLGEKFDMFDDATPPRADTQQREESREDAPPLPPKTPRQGNRPRAPKNAEAPAEMDRYERARWRNLLQTSSRKLARDRARLDESEQGWASTVAAARAAGVPANVLLAAAADADVELPE